MRSAFLNSLAFFQESCIMETTKTREGTDMRRLWCHGKVDSMARPMRRCEAVGGGGGWRRDKCISGDRPGGPDPKLGEIIDLEGRQVLPASRTSHAPAPLCAVQKNLALFGVDSIESIVRMGRERIAQNHPACLLGMGWNQEHLRRAACPSGGTWTASPPRSPSACCGCVPTSPPQHRHGGAADGDPGPGAHGGVEKVT